MKASQEKNDSFLQIQFTAAPVAIVSQFHFLLPQMQLNTTTPTGPCP